MIHIGLTGGIASGKSTVANRFAEHGVPIIDADEASRLAVAPNSPGLSALVAQFGSDILATDGTLNRKKLRREIFNHPQLRLQVEQILHPIIAEIMLQQAAATDAPYLIFMIPLLTQKKGRYPIDRILVVDLPESLQIERVMQRDQITRQEAEAILDAQLGRQERLKIADDTILNINANSIPEQVEQLHQLYLQLADRE